MDGPRTSLVRVTPWIHDESIANMSAGNNTLVVLAYNNDPVPRFADPAIYDSSCPAKNDARPGQGAF
jgi:hypothetical protein